MEKKRSSECAARLALDLFGRVRDGLQNGTIIRPKVVWLELSGCSGNIISLMNADRPDIGYFLTQMVELVFENSLSAPEGGRAMDALFGALNEEFILVVEGAVATRDEGIYTVIGSYQGRHITALEACRTFGERASHVVAMGTCASDGGISAAAPNPTSCTGIQDVLQRPVIRLPGCPCNPAWLITTIAHVLLFGPPELDAFGRPTMIYGTTIHDRCPRRSYFDAGTFATRLGEETCLFLVGCRGPVTLADCPIRRWNERVNWPVQDDSPCIGCAQFGFPDAMEPFILYPSDSEISMGQEGILTTFVTEEKMG
ncbi:MAG TPA: hydrogenase small subunit [Feifaniaceae bacterium]|nr:hydrogenase small subunit [Feifaniaceae bacterium]